MITVSESTLYNILEMTVKKYPDKEAIYYWASYMYLEHSMIASYNDYINENHIIRELPPEVQARHRLIRQIMKGNLAINNRLMPSIYKGESDDIIVLPYTSGTTSLPKGCIHTNKSVQENTIGTFHWATHAPNAVSLAALQIFHDGNNPVEEGEIVLIGPQLLKGRQT